MRFGCRGSVYFCIAYRENDFRVRYGLVIEYDEFYMQLDCLVLGELTGFTLLIRCWRCGVLFPIVAFTSRERIFNFKFSDSFH